VPALRESGAKVQIALPEPNALKAVVGAVAAAFVCVPGAARFQGVFN
jgi:hypothetical protein